MREAFDSFPTWKSRIGRILLFPWEYQLPMATPGSYWANFQLRQEGFRINVERVANSHGCLVPGQSLSNDGLTGRLDASKHEKIWREVNHLYSSDPIRFDSFNPNKLDQYEKYIDYFEGIADEQDPTHTLEGREYLFLGNSEWVVKEALFLSLCRDQYGIPVNSNLLTCLNEIIKERLVLMTFSKLVIVTRN